MTKEEYLNQINDVIKKGKYSDSWESLCKHETPEWYRDAKLGIFIHWGVYSVPAFSNEWYSREMYDKSKPAYKHHIKTYGSQKEFGYKDFIPMFKAEHFNPDEWADLLAESGAKYIMPVSEHHDGFAMYDTEFNEWNSVNMAMHRDVMGELKEAFEKKSLVYCASNHRAEHYFFMNPGREFDSDVNDEKYASFYAPAYYCKELAGYKMGMTTADIRSVSPSEEFLTDWLVRCCEFTDKYKPSVFYFDWWIQNRGFKPYLKKFAAYYYNRAEEWGKQVTINYKKQAYAPGCATLDVERGALTDISPEVWQTCTAIAKNSWGYTENNEFKTPYHIICDFIDIVSKNGNMLLNIGPKSDGTIAKEETEVLRSLGKWLKINGEGIYSSRPFRVFGEGKVNAKEGFFKDGKAKPFGEKDFRFTYNNGCIYAFEMKPTKKSFVRIKEFRKIAEDMIIKSVTLLQTGESLSFERTSKYMQINLNSALDTELPVCFKIEIG